MYIFYLTINTVNCILYIVYCTMYTQYCILHTVYSTLCTANCILNSVHCHCQYVKRNSLWPPQWQLYCVHLTLWLDLAAALNCGPVQYSALHCTALQDSEV